MFDGNTNFLGVGKNYPIPPPKVAPALSSPKPVTIKGNSIEIKMNHEQFQGFKASAEALETSYQKIDPNKKLTREQKEVLYGILLGDASLESNKNGDKFRLRVIQGNNHKEYLFHLHDIFKEFCTSPPNFNPSNQTWYFNTIQHKCFRFYGEQFYKKDASGKFLKKVPRHSELWLTEKAVAYWYSDDGSVKDKNKSTAIRFCTDSFAKEDVDALVNGLQTRYQVAAKTFENNAKERPGQYRIYIGAAKPNQFSSSGVPLTVRDFEFGKQFEQHIISSMKSKLPPLWSTKI